MGFFRRKQVRAVQIKVPEEGYKFSYSRTLQRVEAEKQRQGNQEGIRTFEGLEYKPYELKEETKPKEEVLTSLSSPEPSQLPETKPYTPRPYNDNPWVGFEAIKKIVKKVCYAPTFPFFFPTHIRRYCDRADYVCMQRARDHDPSTEGDNIFSRIILPGILIPFFYIFGLTSDQSTPTLEKIAFANVVTNTLSGLYEWYRYESKKITSSATRIQISQPSQLEKEVEETL